MWGDKYENQERNFTWVMVLEGAQFEYMELLELFSFFDYYKTTGHEFLKVINPEEYDSDGWMSQEKFFSEIDQNLVGNCGGSNGLGGVIGDSGGKGGSLGSSRMGEASNENVIGEGMPCGLGKAKLRGRKKVHKLVGDSIEDIYRIIENNVSKIMLNRNGDSPGAGRLSFVENFQVVIATIGI
jgi:hypothetical protein